VDEVLADLGAIVRKRLEKWPAQWEGYHWPGYTYEHTLRVRNLALRLARETGADELTVELAALLHDIEKPTGRDHAAAGAETARRLLQERDVPPETVERVASAIGSHAGDNTPEHPVENLVLGDADLIDANFGLVGVWRFVTIRAGHGASIEETVNGFEEWLPKKDALMDLLNTEQGMDVAHRRRTRMHRFCADVQAAMESEAIASGLLAMLQHINARHRRGSISQQLPQLCLIAECAGDGAVQACERLRAEAAGEA